MNVVAPAKRPAFILFGYVLLGVKKSFKSYERVVKMDVKNKRQRNELLQLIDDLRKEVTCTICLDLYNDPVSIVECHHTFCKNCYTTLIRVSNKPNCIDCPLCKKSVSKREFEKDEQLSEVVQLVQKYEDILSKQPEIEEIKTPKRNTSKSNVHTSKSNKKKSNKKVETEYKTLAVKKTPNLKKAHSFNCLREKLQNEPKPKRHSLGNYKEIEKEQLIDLFNSQNPLNNINDEIIGLMEEDCLANFEQEFCCENINKPSTSKNKKQQTNNENTDAGWSRIKDIKKNEKKMKQLSISTFSTKTPKIENKRSTRSTEKEKIKTKKSPTSILTENKINKKDQKLESPLRLHKTRSTYKLDQFESYLQNNIAPVNENISNEIENPFKMQKRLTRKSLKQSKSIENVSDEKINMQNSTVESKENQTTIEINKNEKLFKQNNLKKNIENVDKKINDTNSKFESKENKTTVEIHKNEKLSKQNTLKKGIETVNNKKLNDTNSMLESKENQIKQIETNKNEKLPKNSTLKKKCKTFDEIVQSMNKEIIVNSEKNVNKDTNEINIQNDINKMACVEKGNKTASILNDNKMKENEIMLCESESNKRNNIEDNEEDIFSLPTQLNTYNANERNNDREKFDLCTQYYEPNKNEKINNETAKNIYKHNNDEDLDIVKIVSSSENLNKENDDVYLANTQIISKPDLTIKDAGHEKTNVDEIIKDRQSPKITPNITENNKNITKCLEHLKVLQDDIFSHNDIIKEFSQLLTNSRSLFSSISQEKCTEIPKGCSLPNLSNDKEVVDFYNTAIPYLNNLRKLYNDFEIIVQDMTQNTIRLTEVFDENSEPLNNLLSHNKKYSNDIFYEKLPLKTERSIQTDSKIKCPMCFNVFDLNFENDKIYDAKLSIGDTSLNTSDKRVNRQLNFKEKGDEKKFKRIRKQSSDSDSDTEVKKKIKCSNINKYLNEDLDIIFQSKNDFIEPQENKKKPESNLKKKVTQDITDKYMSILEREFKEPLETNKINNKIIPNQNNKKVTQDVTEKYMSILEREYKELNEQKQKNSTEFNENIITDTILNNKSAQKKNYSQFSKSLFTENDKYNPTLPYNSYKPLEVLKINTQIEKEFNNSFKENTDPKRLESQFSRSMFSETNNFIKNNPTQNLVLSEKDKLSMSLFTNMERNNSMLDHTKNDKTILAGQESPKDMFDDELDAEIAMHLSNQSIVEDSLDGSDSEKVLFNAENVVESTPFKERLFKRKRTESKSNLDELVEVLNEDASMVQSQIDLNNTEWLHNIAPPPEFQDEEANNSKLTIDNQNAKSATPEFFSLSPRPITCNILNERIELTDLSNTLNTSIKNTSPMDMSGVIEGTIPDVPRKKNLDPLTLLQNEKSSPLTLIKSKAYVPKTISNSPKPIQMKIMDYMKTPIKNLTPSTSQSSQKNNDLILNESMDITPIKTPLKSKKYICIACTRLGTLENSNLISMTKEFNLEFTKQFTDRVTHLVVTVDDRNRIKDLTMKYVSAISKGLWIVSFHWVRDCLQHNRILPEEQYEVLDISGMPGPQKSRLTGRTRPLLRDFVFYCPQPFVTVTTHDIENVLINLGAEIVTNVSSLKKKGKICLVLTECTPSQDLNPYQHWFDTMNIISVEIEWLSRSVGKYEVGSLRPFMICEDNGEENEDYPSYLLAVVPESLTECTDHFTEHH